MCGIVGLFAKDKAFEAELGRYLAPMLIEMSERGPDSAGIAVYRDPLPADRCKLTVLAVLADFDWTAFASALRMRCGESAQCRVIADHAVLSTEGNSADLTAWIREEYPELRINSSGHAIEIYKQTGLPREVISHFNVENFRGTHALGHTRMATESAVTTEHSHPFSTGEDLCLVHNGSLSNHFTLRNMLSRHGVQFSTDNDSEVAAGYLTWRLREGDTLEAALERALVELDGFYTFAVGTREGFAVLRDPIACKPAVIAETDTWVAIASEYRAIALLPGAGQAQCWEPEPARIYSWSHQT